MAERRFLCSSSNSSSSEIFYQEAEYRVKIVSEGEQGRPRQIANQTKNRFKCFKCFSKEGSHDPKCRECLGTGYIAAPHPLLQTMETIFSKRIKETTDNPELKKKMMLMLPGREVINEESFSMQEEHSCISRCSEGEEKELNQGKQTPGLSKKWLQGIYPDVQYLKRISEQVEPEESINELSRMVHLCSNCKETLGIQYFECRNCRDKDQLYLLCENCLSQNQFLHDTGHKFFAKNLNTSHFLQNSAAIAGSESSLTSERQQSQADNSFVNICAELSHSYESENQFSKKQSGNCDKSVQFFDFKDSKSRLSNTDNGWITNVNEIERYFSEEMKTNFHCSLADSQPLLLPSELLKQSLNDCRVQLTRSIEKKMPNVFYFEGYQCDYCQKLPIINVRYHCGVCENFDLCEDCFKNRKSEHNHQDFILIDGKVLKEKRDQQLRKITLKASQQNLPLRKIPENIS